MVLLWCSYENPLEQPVGVRTTLLMVPEHRRETGRAGRAHAAAVTGLLCAGGQLTKLCFGGS